MSGRAAKAGLQVAGAAMVVLFGWLTYRYFDGRALLRHLSGLARHPAAMAAAVFVYGTSFWLRAWAWKQYVGKPLVFSIYWRGVLLSLLINHLVPVKMGDAARVAVLARQPGVSAAEAIESVAVMRLLDMAVLGVFAAAGVYVYMHRIPGLPLAGAAAAGGALVLVMFRRPLRLERLWRRWRTVL
ncbi:lysylphosphatidylglycerol synthase domain-containing protein, partial [Geobacillus stearothermophilus]|nr:lysylphosphatidylglycerol synthase domain-containing protein [Geobacillus stearothermophilus]